MRSGYPQSGHYATCRSAQISQYGCVVLILRYFLKSSRACMPPIRIFEVKVQIIIMIADDAAPMALDPTCVNRNVRLRYSCILFSVHPETPDLKQVYWACR